MSDDSQQTTDHDTSRAWAKERDGRPTHVEDTGGGGDEDGGLLRINIEDADKPVAHVSRDEFGETGTENNPAVPVSGGDQRHELRRYVREPVTRRRIGSDPISTHATL